MGLSRDQIAEAVLAFINARTWIESKQILNAHRDVLLSDAADEVLDTLLEHYRDDKEATRILQEHRTLLSRSRREDIESAFAHRLSLPVDPHQSELATLLEELQGLTEQGDPLHAVAVAREVLELVSSDKEPALWAMLHVYLGDAYRRLIEGDRSENLERTIRHFEQALEVYTRQDFPEQWADVQNNLGNAYLGRIRGNRPENLERAIEHYEQALEIYGRATSPANWAKTQYNLANAYANRNRGDRAQNLEEAIRHFEQALEVYTRQDFPEHWAMAQNNLGEAHRQRIYGARVDNLEWSIYHFQRALEAYTLQDFPEHWAMAQNNLAVAFVERIRGDQAENIERAIHHFEQALEVYTRQDFPEQWAETHNNLANAYRQRIRGDQAENLEQAIHHYEQALEVNTRQDFLEQWATTQNNLAAAYSERIRGDRVDNLKEAIRHYEQALEIYTRQDFPEQWADVQNNLGNAYRQRIYGDRVDNLEEAIRHYEQALEVYTRQYLPEQWATTQNNLGEAYRERIQGDRAENLERAIHHYRLALEVRTARAFPRDCWNTAYALGNLFYEEHRFTEARAAFMIAHQAVEVLRSRIQREDTKRDLAEQNATLYARLVHSCLLESDEDAAFEYAVAAKGRAFVDMLATARFDLSAAGANDPELAEDLRQARELRQQIDNMLARLGDDGASTSDGTERRSLREKMRADLRTLQRQHTAFWEEMSYKYPALTATQQAPAFTTREAYALAADLGATLVEYYRHADGWCAFVVNLGSVRYIALPDVDDDLLERMFKWTRRIELPAGRNSLSYEPLYQLHEALIAPLRAYLPPGRAVVLAPFSWLHLLPLSAARDPASSRYAADDYRLTFAPSLAALRVVRDQAQRGATLDNQQQFERLLSVAYPGTPGSAYYLPNVVPEAEAVARHFSQVTQLYREAATPDAVIAHARNQDAIHLSCHGWFDFEDPEQSGLLLSGGWLTVQRVLTEMRLDRTLLVTLSANVSGLMQVRRGEEHIGLVQAMMLAGAGSVIASLWPVDDTATRALFEAFYTEITSGNPPADALSNAAQLVRSQPGWEHPFYWAAFQISGLAHGPARLPSNKVTHSGDI